MFCEKCGKEIPEGSNWCPFCGKKKETVTNRYARIAIAIIGVVSAVLFFIGAVYGLDKMNDPAFNGYMWTILTVLTFMSLGFFVFSLMATVYFYNALKK